MLFSTIAVAAFAGSSFVGAAPILEARKEAPSHWKHNILENYLEYHTRYLALSCYEKHDTDFFSQCCRPLRSNEQLSDRPAECTPSEEALEAAKARVAAKAQANPSSPGADAAVPSDDAVSQYVSDAVAQQTAAATSTEAAAAEQTSPANFAAQQAVGDDPTTTQEVQPEPTSTEESKPQPTQESNNNGETYFGQGTYYLQHEGADPSGLGSCGYKNSDSDFIAAISTTGGSTWGNTRCGQFIRVTNRANGKSVDVQIVDNCPSCRDANSIDLSLPAFEAIALEATGEIEIEWHFI